MQYTSQSLEKLIHELSKLPSVGRKTAQRLSFYLLKQSDAEVRELVDALLSVKSKIIKCSTCFNITETDPCVICNDSRRDRHTICVVEEANDVLAIERTNQYRGLYHVLGGVINPLEGIAPDDLRINQLMDRVDGTVAEIILAINPNVPGDATVIYLSEQLQKHSVRISRIARGIPIGSDLEFADSSTLTRALEGRVSL